MFNTPPLGAATGGTEDLFPRIRKSFKEKSSIPQSLLCGSSLQTIRNNLKWLFNNKENLSNKKTSIINNDTDYPTTKAVKDALDTKQNNLTAGTGITLNNDTVSIDTAANLDITGTWTVPTPAL
ncbi:MAG: hypothetical protein LBD18_05715 [Treponema sp.]|nr:hypothetical protein [Treponema sp.]